jgi:membrane protease YdiL (CAAX protease family)
MRHDRSVPLEPSAVHAATLPWPAAIAVTLLGVAAMSASPLLGLHRGGLRTQVAVGTLLLAIPALAALAARPAFLRGAVGPWPVASRVLGLAAALGLALWVASVGLMEIQSLVVPPTPEYLELFRRLHHALAPTGPFDAIVSLAVIAALPGLCEELLVRGTLLPSLVRPLGPAGAVIVSSILFAAMHLDAFRFLFTLSVGLVLGIVRLRTGSLWPPVVAHVTLNGLTFLIAPLVDDPSKAYTPEPLLGFGALALGVALSWPLLQRLRPAVPRAA